MSLEDALTGFERAQPELLNYPPFPIPQTPPYPLVNCPVNVAANDDQGRGAA